MSLLNRLSNVFFKKISLKVVNNSYKLTRFNDKDFMSYHTGSRILEDSQVSIGFMVFKYMLSSQKYSIKGDDELKDFVEDMFTNMEVNLSNVVRTMLEGVLWGFNLQELVYGTDKHNNTVIKDIIPLEYDSFIGNPFIYDDEGNLIAVEQNVDNKSVEIPIEKLMHFKYGSLKDTGHGLLWKFKPLVEDKININQWLMTFLERHESPTLYAKTDNNYNRKGLLNALKNVSDGTENIIVGANDELGVLETAHRGETFFKRWTQIDNQIFRLYGLGNLLLGDNSQTGTYAQSQTQKDIAEYIFDGVLSDIANTIQKQIINPLITINYGEEVDYPLFEFEKFNKPDLKGLLTVIQSLINDNIISDSNPAVHELISKILMEEAGIVYNESDTEIEEDFSNNSIDVTNITNDLLKNNGIEVNNGNLGESEEV